MELVLFGHALSNQAELYSFFQEESLDRFAMNCPLSMGYLGSLRSFTNGAHNE
jgi:hypothetical protein